MTTTTQPPTATEVTPADLAELERLALEVCATPERGPYRVIQGSDDWRVVNGFGRLMCESCTEDEARFIAAACNAVPSLIAQLRAEQAAREAAERELVMCGESEERMRVSLRESDDARMLAQRERDEARQRAERAEAGEEELRAMLAKRVEVYGYQWYVWDLDEARALLARMGAERKDGVA